MNQIISWGNYLAILPNGSANYFMYSKKNTKIDIYTDKVVISETGGGEYTIKKSDVDSGSWGNMDVPSFIWDTLTDFLVNNTGNFSSAAGGSAAKYLKARVFLGPIPQIFVMFEDGIGLNLFGVSRSGVGSYQFSWENEIDPTKMRILPIPLSNIGVSFGALYSASSATIKVTDYTGNNIDPYQSMELTIEYFG